MAKYEVVMPKMGESVQEATIIKWFKKEGDHVVEDDVLLEISTDKVDSEIPSPIEGVIEKILYNEEDVIAVGEVIAIINMNGDEGSENKKDKKDVKEQKKEEKETKPLRKTPKLDKISRFYSPLVKNIAKKENISIEELEKIEGTGENNRVKKQDILNYIKTKQRTKTSAGTVKNPPKVDIQVYEGDEIIEMDRMRKMIADHMILSKQTSPHVTNFIEVDVTNIVLWRNKIKDNFLNREKQKLTYLPVFIEATARTLREFPGINASVDIDKIILRKKINIGVAVALPNGNLIVPVIKNADQKSLVGLTLEMNALAENARNNKLKPDDIQEGTFSISNFGTFKNLTGTPIINQPQVAILATGNIEKKPSVLETESGDVIAIRHKMMLSLSYDHRVVDGALAGKFLLRIKELLENYDINRSI